MVFTVHFEAQGQDSSYGQFPDGSGNWQHMNPTPGGPNTAELSIIDKGQLLAVGSVQEIQASTGVNNLEDAVKKALSFESLWLRTKSSYYMNIGNSYLNRASELDDRI